MKYHISIFSLMFCTALYAPQTIIKHPGTYILDITRSYNPGDPNDTIIRIDASDVILDFKDHAIDQLSGNAQAGLNGITISSLVSNVTIQNAHIKNLTGVGIQVNNATTKINILDSKIESCASGGILLNGTTPGVVGCNIKNTSVTTCTGYGGNPAYGIRVIKSNLVVIENVTTSGNDAVTTSSGYGISIENSTQCGILNSTAVKNGGSGIAAGIAIIASSNIILIDDSAALTTAYFGSSFGFMIEQCSNLLAKSCRSSANLNASFPCYGAGIQNGQRNVFEEFTTGFNSSTQLTAGILLNNESQSIILNSTSRGNSTSATGTTYGILLTGTCDKCTIDTNKIINNSGSSASFGIVDQRDQSTSVILGNLSFNNGTSFSVTYTGVVELPVTDASLSDFPGTSDINTSNAYMNLNITS